MTNNNDSIIRNNLQMGLLNSLKQYTDKPAFFFGDTYFSYQQLIGSISQLQTLLLAIAVNESDSV